MLSVEEQNKNFLVANKVVDVLVKYLRHPERIVNEQAALSIRGLSDKSEAIADPDMVIGTLLEALKIPSIQVHKSLASSYQKCSRYEAIVIRHA